MPSARIRVSVVLGLALALASVSSASGGVSRYADMPLRLVKLTDTRYGNDCLWGGPRGIDYARLPHPDPVQIPNLYPDAQATYFVDRFTLPPGARLTLRGRYPHSRYFSYAINTGGLAGDSLSDREIAPDRGSRNPFVPGHLRNTRWRDRHYTVHVVPGPVPARRAHNALYTGSVDPSHGVQVVHRIYVPDRSRDGTGDARLPAAVVTLAGGSRLTGAAACRALQANPKPQGDPGFPQGLWQQLVASSDDPINAPVARHRPVERFWNVCWSALATFEWRDPADRLARCGGLPTDNGGFASNPDTRYLLDGLSRKFGKVYTLTARMPKIASTYPNARRMPGYEDRFWSTCSGAAPPTGTGYDCVFDQQVALRGHGRYTIVISRPGDRPRNALKRCGYTWLDFGEGEGYPGGRDYLDYLYMRFMQPSASFHRGPHDVTKPGTEPRVMGPYFPKGRYWTKAGFERRGCPMSRD